MATHRPQTQDFLEVDPSTQVMPDFSTPAFIRLRSNLTRDGVTEGDAIEQLQEGWRLWHEELKVKWREALQSRTTLLLAEGTTEPGRPRAVDAQGEDAPQAGGSDQNVSVPPAESPRSGSSAGPTVNAPAARPRPARRVPQAASARHRPACAVCLGRHRHDYTTCHSATLWDGTTPARCRWNAEKRMVDLRGNVVCLSWQTRNGCPYSGPEHGFRHECSGCGSSSHGAQSCGKSG